MADKKGSSTEKNSVLHLLRQKPARGQEAIAGPSVFICDERIDLCNEIIRDEQPPPPMPRKVAAICLRPLKSRPI